MFQLSSLLLRRRYHHHCLILSKTFSTSTPPSPPPPPPVHLPLSHPTYLIWSSNTSLGKTLVSAGIAASFLHFPPTSTATKFLYLKPIQTGFPSDSDSRFLFHKLQALSLRRRPTFHLISSHHILQSSLPAAKSFLGVSFEPQNTEICGSGMCDLGWCEEKKRDGGDKIMVSELICKTMYAWNEAVSPHLAAEREKGVVKDSEVVEMLQRCLIDGLGGEAERERLDGLCVVETAGGVASPGPSGSLQCDLYRPFRLPAILVGDGRLGGISGTISAYESLKLRGYDVVAVVFEDHGLVNEVPLMQYLRHRPFRLPAILVGDGRLGGISGTISAYESLKLRGYDVVAVVFEDHGLVNEVPLMQYLRHRVPVLVLPPVPQDRSNDLMEWFDDSIGVFNSLKEIMLSAYSKRLQSLHDMAKKAGDVFWWPFTQHKLVPEEGVTVIDSRCGENFSVYKVYDKEFITQQFDACASWWTQGPDTTLQTELARDMGYAAARFGHVMFPENVYEPVLECAELLLEGVGKGWASRTYFSDNGSTAIEIALKMAFRKFSFDHGILEDFLTSKTAKKCIEFKVLALRGSYHGDTLGAMEAQAPSSYTGFLQQPWYTGRGLFLDPPTVFMDSGIWNLSLPQELHSKNLTYEDTTFSSRDQIFDQCRDMSDLSAVYSSYIARHLRHHSRLKENSCIGALIIEPVVQASGGMHMIDPLFQRVLVNECRNRKIPIIFDEVFTGFWRLGAETAAELLCSLPDIACFGKLMTGGILPLAATLATDAVFDSFAGDSKLKALLHGHSYSAHAMGCTAAAKSIRWFKDPKTNLNMSSEGRLLMELWDAKLVHQISSHPTVKRVVALGTLCALELQAEGCNAGYGSLYASSLLKKLREDGVYMRPLGNVIYLMCGPCTSPDICRQLLIKLYRRLEEFSESNVK